MFLKVKRETKYEHRYTPKMGLLTVPVTRVKLMLLGVPFKTLHEYRRTYYGEVKDLKDCKLNK